MAKIDNISDIDIESAIKTGKSWIEVCKILEIAENSYNSKRLKEFAEANSLDISHFVKKLSREEYEANPKTCLNCGKMITWEHRDNNYCSRSCAAIINNKGVQRNKPKSGRFCKNCGKELNANHKVYCSQKCQTEFEQNEYIDRWKQGLEDGSSGKFQISDRIRKYLMDKYDCKCEKCDWGEVHPITGNIPLQIHHIDGDATNNKEENLQLLCPNCHTLTENYGSLNKNATRIDTRKRY